MFRSAEHAVAWYYSTEGQQRCFSVEGRAEPMSAAAGADGWIPPFSGQLGDPERLWVSRAEIACALGQLDAIERELVRRVVYLRQPKKRARLGLTEWQAYRRVVKALGIVHAELVRRGVVRGGDE